MTEIARHIGTVASTKEGTVTVTITTMGACGSCSAHSHCGFHESKERAIDIATPEWKDYRQGQQVEVTVNESLGVEAVWWAYILPAVILITTILLSLHYTANEPLSILITIGIVVIYYLVLYRFRNQLQRHFGFTVRHLTEG